MIWRIVLPLAKRAIVVTCVMVLITVWNEYLFATTFLLESDYYFALGGAYQLQSNDYTRSWPLFTAASILASIPLLLIFFKIQKYMVSGLTAGGRERIGMKKEAIFHRPMSEYAFGLDEDTTVFRLRCAPGDLECCTLWYGDTSSPETPVAGLSCGNGAQVSRWKTATGGRRSCAAHSTDSITTSSSLATRRCITPVRYLFTQPV